MQAVFTKEEVAKFGEWFFVRAVVSVALSIKCFSKALAFTAQLPLLQQTYWVSSAYSSQFQKQTLGMFMFTIFCGGIVLIEYGTSNPCPKTVQTNGTR